MRLRDEPKDVVFTIEMSHCLQYNVNYLGTEFLSACLELFVWWILNFQSFGKLIAAER